MSVLMNSASVVVTGNLTRDPQMVQRGGQNVCDFSVGVRTDRKTTPTSNEYINNYYECSLWGKQGEYLAQHAKKGDCVTVRGSLAQTTYLGRDGTQKNSLQIRADGVSVARVTDNAQQETAAAPKRAAAPAPAPQVSVYMDPDDDQLPF